MLTVEASFFFFFFVITRIFRSRSCLGHLPSMMGLIRVGARIVKMGKKVHQVHRILLTNSNLFLSLVVGVHSEGCRRVKVDIHYFIFHWFLVFLF